MTPQEKAIEIFNWFYMAVPFSSEGHNKTCKACAIKLAAECEDEAEIYGDKWGEDGNSTVSIDRNIFWREVQEEIKNFDPNE